MSAAIAGPPISSATAIPAIKSFFMMPPYAGLVRLAEPVVQPDLCFGNACADAQARGIGSGDIPVAKPDVVQLCLGRPFASQAEFRTKAHHPTPNSLRHIGAGGEHVVRIETMSDGHKIEIV